MTLESVIQFILSKMRGTIRLANEFSEWQLAAKISVNRGKIIYSVYRVKIKWDDSCGTALQG